MPPRLRMALPKTFKKKWAAKAKAQGTHLPMF
jgi:hypothetical protein